MQKIWGVAGLAALALTVSACASSGSSSASTGSTPAAGTNSSSAAAASSATAAAGGSSVSQQSIGGQQVLVDSQGKVLYWFARDTSTASNCSGACLTFWPPVQGPLTAGSGVTGTLGTITRADGSKQATYDGHPLYTFAGDKSPGQNKGNGLNQQGGLWWEMTVSGATPAPAAKSTATASSGGYGY